MKKSRKNPILSYDINNSHLQRVYDFVEAQLEFDKKRMFDAFVRFSILSSINLNDNVPFDGFKFLKKVINDFEEDCKKCCAAEGLSFSTGKELKKIIGEK